MSLRFPRATWAALLVLCSPYLPRVVADEPTSDATLPDDIRSAQQRIAAALDPVTLEWITHRSSTLAMERLLNMIGYAQYERDFLEPMRAVYAWNDGRFYAHFYYKAAIVGPEERFQKLEAMEQEASYDGSRLYIGTPQGERHDGILIIDPVDQLKGTEPESRLLRSNYLKHAGYWVPERVGELGGDLQSMMLHMLESGAKLERIEELLLDGKPCQKIVLNQGSTQYLFVIDQSLDYSVRSFEKRTSEGRLIESATASDFMRLEGDEAIWLPKNCVIEYHQWRGSPSRPSARPLFRESYSLLRIDRGEIPPSNFEVMYTNPGASIADGSLPEAENSATQRIEYLVPANPDDLDAAIKHAIDGTPFVPSHLRGKRNATLVVFLANLALLLIIVAIFARRRYRAG